MPWVFRAFLLDLAVGLVPGFDFVAPALPVPAFAVFEDEALLGVAVPVSFCIGLPAAPSAEMGARTINTLRALASQRVPIEIVSEWTVLWETESGGNTSFISPLYDDSAHQCQARTTTVNGDVPVTERIVWFPAPLSGKLSL